jgi:hypothetical protein
MAQSQDSHHLSVNAPDAASGSPINSRNPAMIAAKTRNTMRVSLSLTDDEIFIYVWFLTRKLRSWAGSNDFTP